MKQYEFDGKILKLKIKKSPILVRGIMFLFAFLLFIMPFVGLLLYIASGNGFHISFAIGIFIFALLGFYLLRVALWNSYGNEILSFNKNSVDYIADYGWFKDGRKTIEIQTPFLFTIEQVGYIEDNKGVLKIGEGEAHLLCVTKMPIVQLEQLIKSIES